MKKLQPPRDLIEALGEAYELLLENALKKAKQSGVAMHQIMATVRDDAMALHKFSDDEAIKLEAYIKRDLVDAAQYLNKTGKKLEGWVGFDVALVKREFWEYFAEAADQTTMMKSTHSAKSSPLAAFLPPPPALLTAFFPVSSFFEVSSDAGFFSGAAGGGDSLKTSPSICTGYGRSFSPLPTFVGAARNSSTAWYCSL